MRQGFTLVELAIVLVIIGLLVAGVLGGQELVRQSELRATVSQFEEYMTAVGIFKTKFDGFPGDIEGGDATRPLFTPGSAGATAHDDDCTLGNGILSSGIHTTVNTCQAQDTGSENVIFWAQLGSDGAALIPGSFDGSQITTTASDVANSVPAAKSKGYWSVYAASGVNYMVLGATTPSTTAYLTTSAVLLPSEAMNIDRKIDNDMPLTGSVTARTAANNAPDTADTYLGPPATAGSACMHSDGLIIHTYYNGQTSATSCLLRFRMSM